jgi:hypothetical protein
MAIVEDLGAFLADFGVPCVFGAQQFLALLDQPDEILELPRAAAHSRQYLITYRTAQATLARGDAGSVEGAAYTVREAPRQVDDGAFTQALLSKT